MTPDERVSLIEKCEDHAEEPFTAGWAARREQLLLDLPSVTHITSYRRAFVILGYLTTVLGAVYLLSFFLRNTSWLYTTLATVAHFCLALAMYYLGRLEADQRP